MRVRDDCQVGAALEGLRLKGYLPGEHSGHGKPTIGNGNGSGNGNGNGSGKCNGSSGGRRSWRD